MTTVTPAAALEGAQIDVQSDADEVSETELELERLVFGDSAGFRQGLKGFTIESDDNEVVKIAEEDLGLAHLDDADLFFTDLGDNNAQLSSALAKVDEVADDTFSSRRPAAWEDSDDERLLVSLASVPRLRKLRHTEAEDIVDGKEYSRRLRHQYELLNPRPEWAVYALETPARKRRRTSLNGRHSPVSSDDEMEIDQQPATSTALRKLLQGSGSLTRDDKASKGKRRKLRPEVLNVQRSQDVGTKQPSAITSLAFHPHLPLLMSSGPSSTLFLHHISPSPPAPIPNPLLTSLHVRNNPLTTTFFHPTDGRIFLSSHRRHFYTWNINTGTVERTALSSEQAHDQRSVEYFRVSPEGLHVALLGTTKKDGGVVNILSATSLQWITQARVESKHGIADFCWWNDGRGITIAAKNGEVTEWSLEQQRVVARWRDEGAVGTTTLSLGGRHEFSKSTIGTDRWIAIGSTSGIVNVYDRRQWFESVGSTPSEQLVPSDPKPTKTLDHLTTPTSKLAFSHDGQLLAMSSKWKPDALKLVHLPSCTVFRNWPTSSTPLGRVTCVAFASGDVVDGDLHSLMAVANEQGKVRLWEIR